MKGDPERLEQVLLNLMSTAGRFTENGEISLRMEETIGAEERTSLRFEVRDTGSGITESVRNRLFQPFSMFQRINSTGVPITGGNQGNGLSLAISKKLVELMGGKIDVAPSQAAAGLFLSPLYLKTFTPVPNLRLNPTRPVRPPLPERPELARDRLLAQSCMLKGKIGAKEELSFNMGSITRRFRPDPSD